MNVMDVLRQCWHRRWEQKLGLSNDTHQQDMAQLRAVLIAAQKRMMADERKRLDAAKV